MSYTVKIEKVGQFHDQSTNSKLLDVRVSVKAGTKTVATKRMSFPLDTSEKEIEAAVAKYGNTFVKDAASAVRQKEQEAKQENANAVSKKLTGTTLTVSESDTGVNKKKK